jgi:hypothetical protein
VSTGGALSGSVPEPRAIHPVLRARFIPADGREADVLRRYEDPRPAYAIEDAQAQWSADDVARAAPGADDRLITIWMPPDAQEGFPLPAIQGRGRAIVARGKGAASIEWAPGVVVARCEAEAREEVTAAVLDFSFLERELRQLESFLKEAERRAREDLPAAHRLRGKDRSGWEPLARAFEQVTAARLTFARLEPQLAPGARDLGAGGRRWFARLCRSARISARLEAASDRLEALEDFYEGANQRIAEFRWYREGHRLEKGIIGILLFECVLMIAEIVIHLRH